MVYDPVSVLRSETLFSRTPVGTCLKFGQTANTNMMNDCRRSFPNRRVLSLIYLPLPCFGWDHASNRGCDHVPFEHARLQPNVASSYNRRGSCYSNQSTQPWWCRVLRHWLHYKQHVKQHPLTASRDGAVGAFTDICIQVPVQRRDGVLTCREASNCWEYFCLSCLAYIWPQR